jgi:multiple sugar transport system substrate-binding protein
MSETDERVRTLIEEANRLRYSRRGVIKRGAALGVSGAGITAALGASGHKVAAKSAARLQTGGKLTVLAGSYFVPEAQEFFVSQVNDWGSQNGFEVQCDFVNWPDIQAKVSAAVESGAGPDVVELRETWPYLYYEQMVDLNEMALKIGEAGGGFYEWATNTAAVDGNYYSIPVGTSSIAMAYRISHLEAAGVTGAADAANFPQTWEELFALGKNLKAAGKPLGQALGQSTGDPPGFAYPYMWSYGAMEVDEEGNVAFNTPEFVEGMNLFIQGWKTASTRPASPGTTRPTTGPSSPTRSRPRSTAPASTSLPRTTPPVSTSGTITRWWSTRPTSTTSASPAARPVASAPSAAGPTA